MKVLYWRLSTTFFVLSICGALFFAYVFSSSWRQYQRITDRRVNWNLAEILLKDIRPYIKHPPNEAKIRALMRNIKELNPGLELYILDKEANVLLADSNIDKNSVRKKGLQSFIQYFGLPADPEKGGYALRSGSYQAPSIFSIVQINYGNTPAYFYVVLAGEEIAASEFKIGELTLGWSSLLIFVFTTVFASLIGFVLFFPLNKRFRDMTRVVREFESGNYANRISDTSNDEIGAHARAFNQMADTIESQVKKLKQTDALRRELTANVSHELGRPLALMLLSLESLASNEIPLDKDSRQRLVEKAIKSCIELKQLVADLLELSKLEAKETELATEAFSLGELTNDVYQKFKEAAEQKNIDMTLEYSDEQPDVDADIAKIDRAVSNLVENAIRYTPDGGKVFLKVSAIANDVVFECRDTGIGIPEQDLPHVFDRFYRSSAARLQVKSGTGLGLAITKGVIDAHRGNINVESSAGCGTTFSFSLPIAECQ